MRIGYSVQASTDRALLEGLRRRWCQDAELIPGPFRGSTSASHRREYRKICLGFVARSADVMVFLTDADAEDWREVQRHERSRFPQEHLFRAAHGVADRNVECWICAESEWLARRLGSDADQLRGEDPKPAFERALGIDRGDRKEAEIAEVVTAAPLRAWLRNASFEDFYEQLRDQSQRLGCLIENLRERAGA